MAVPLAARGRSAPWRAALECRRVVVAGAIVGAGGPFLEAAHGAATARRHLFQPTTRSVSRPPAPRGPILATFRDRSAGQRGLLRIGLFLEAPIFNTCVK